jgi:hypothetical protein
MLDGPYGAGAAGLEQERGGWLWGCGRQLVFSWVCCMHEWLVGGEGGLTVFLAAKQQFSCLLFSFRAEVVRVAR